MGSFEFFEIGWSHILTEGFDHIAYIVSLGAVFAGKSIKKMLILLTAFTVGHSLTLVFASLGWLEFSSEWVEKGIVLTLILNAAFQLYLLLKNKEIGGFLVSFYLTTFAFGLIHGLGFSSNLSGFFEPGWELVAPVFMFNLGIEAGQIVVAALVYGLYFLFEQFKAKQLQKKALSLCLQSAVLVYAVFLLF